MCGGAAIHHRGQREVPAFARCVRGIPPLRTRPTRHNLAVPGGGNGGGSAIRLIVIDDHPHWRDTLRGLLEHGGVATVVAEAATGDEAVEVSAAVDADVIVLDINMPRLSGIDAHIYFCPLPVEGGNGDSDDHASHGMLGEFRVR